MSAAATASPALSRKRVRFVEELDEDGRSQHSVSVPVDCAGRAEDSPVAKLRHIAAAMASLEKTSYSITCEAAVIVKEQGVSGDVAGSILDAQADMCDGLSCFGVYVKRAIAELEAKNET